MSELSQPPTPSELLSRIKRIERENAGLRVLARKLQVEILAHEKAIKYLLDSGSINLDFLGGKIKDIHDLLRPLIAKNFSKSDDAHRKLKSLKLDDCPTVKTKH